uniref:Gcn5-related n-acetyltransferase protein (Modular protein) n=1 Tax=blood disease bacterium R229 TaxID=741978 RepID=G2ZKM2_9RALS|nr:Gcn5-related n-acetyltransferase protein (modular protein) [blood disease bacterium R229]
MADGNVIVIRPLADSDAVAFKALRLKAIQDSPSAVQPTYEEEAARTLDDMRHRIRVTEHEVVFGAFRGDALIGVTGLRRHVPVQAAHKAVLWGVFVDPAHRRGGVARRLLDAAIGHAVCAGVADPVVREYGEPARPGAVPRCGLRGIRGGAARAVCGRPVLRRGAHGAAAGCGRRRGRARALSVRRGGGPAGALRPVKKQQPAKLCATRVFGLPQSPLEEIWCPGEVSYLLCNLLFLNNYCSSNGLRY